MSNGHWFPEKIEGRHALGGLLGFFGVMLIANGIFLYFALQTFNGFETTDAYRKGLNYNALIASDEMQAVRGWQPVLRYERKTRRLVIEVRDRQGQAVRGLTISSHIRRPVTDAADRTLVLMEVAPATYVASINLAPGKWTIAAQLFEKDNPGEPAHRLKQRLWVEQAK